MELIDYLLLLAICAVAYAAGEALARVHIPRLPVYLAVGAVAGAIFSRAEDGASLTFPKVSTVALAFIGFVAGSHLVWKVIRPRLRPIIAQVLGLSIAVPIVVGITIFVVTAELPDDRAARRRDPRGHGDAGAVAARGHRGDLREPLRRAVHQARARRHRGHGRRGRVRVLRHPARRREPRGGGGRRRLDRSERPGRARSRAPRRGAGRRSSPHRHRAHAVRRVGGPARPRRRGGGRGAGAPHDRVGG